MAIFSKPISVSPTCYELGHCWTPYCRKASTDIAGNVFKEALKIYGTLYLIAGILRKKGPKYYIKKFIPETLRSSLFLTINGTLFISMFCIWSHLVGPYIYYNVYVCAIPACIVSILVEQKSRRGPLAVYLTNLAIETGYRMLVERKLVSPVPNGEVYLFSAVSAVYLYLFRKQNGLSPASESLFRFFIGSEENPPRKDAITGQSGQHDRDVGQSHSSDSSSTTSSSSPSTTSKLTEGQELQEDNESSRPRTSPTPRSPAVSSQTPVAKSVLTRVLSRFPVIASVVRDLQEQWRAWLGSLEQLPRHRCCPHEHSCLSYILKGGARMFSFGYVVQAAISSFSVLTSILKRPSRLKDTMFSRLNLKLAAFLGGYSAIFRAVNCLLRWVRKKDSELHGCVAGALAGLSLRFYRSVTVALYAATKLVEILYFKGIESYGLPYIKCADIFIYAFSTAFIFHAAVMEPHTLRPGYWKFLLRVTDNKFAMMNRHLLDVFGVNSSKLQPDYWPDYDPAFTQLARPKS